MASTPLIVKNRPFAIEPITGIMMPDGIFDASIFIQRITCHVRNTSNRELRDVKVYLEGVSDPGIAASPTTHYFDRVPPGAAVLVAWEADFRNATPGKPFVSIVCKERDNDIARSLKSIYVSRTTYDEAADKFVCEVPEGRLEVSSIVVAGPRSDAWKPLPGCDPLDPEARREEQFGPYLPLRFDAVFVPNPAYAGTHGDLPFADPWWKVLGWVVFAVATIAGIILAATAGGTFFVGLKGKWDVDSSGVEVDCCEPDYKSVAKESELAKGKLTAAGIMGIVATVGLAVGLADDEDAWWRGQAATPPANGALTRAESLSVRLTYPEPPNPGLPYTVGAAWTYTRQTTAGALTHSVDESQTNTHISEGIEIEASSPIHAFAEPLLIRARFARSGATLYEGPELFALAVVISPNGDYGAMVALVDDGITPDESAGDGTYSGELHLERAFGEMRQRGLQFEGRWRVLVFAQDVNLADDSQPPEVQAQTIGGFVLTSPVTLTFDSSLPCPITAHATVEVHT
jgi:hypothetical protein